jgi:hypothetical protein
VTIRPQQAPQLRAEMFGHANISTHPTPTPTSSRGWTAGLGLDGRRPGLSPASESVSERVLTRVAVLFPEFGPAASSVHPGCAPNPKRLDEHWATGVHPREEQQHRVLAILPVAEGGLERR